MSELWHQHLEHLSWWEEIDRFFFPSKYSCSVNYGYDSIFLVLQVFVIICIVVGTILLLRSVKK